MKRLVTAAIFFTNVADGASFSVTCKADYLEIMFGGGKREFREEKSFDLTTAFDANKTGRAETEYARMAFRVEAGCLPDDDGGGLRFSPRVLVAIDDRGDKVALHQSAVSPAAKEAHVKVVRAGEKGTDGEPKDLLYYSLACSWQPDVVPSCTE